MHRRSKPRLIHPRKIPGHHHRHDGIIINYNFVTSILKFSSNIAALHDASRERVKPNRIFSTRVIDFDEDRAG